VHASTGNTSFFLRPSLLSAITLALLPFSFRLCNPPYFVPFFLSLAFAAIIAVTFFGAGCLLLCVPVSLHLPPLDLCGFPALTSVRPSVVCVAARSFFPVRCPLFVRMFFFSVHLLFCCLVLRACTLFVAFRSVNLSSSVHLVFQFSHTFSFEIAAQGRAWHASNTEGDNN
jgi:hypothetical protein